MPKFYSRAPPISPLVFPLRYEYVSKYGDIFRVHRILGQSPVRFLVACFCTRSARP